ncbi:hypothetical protein FSP39_019888 [Pinctada imbricata]|uniref:Uncharacterized protein n=1 Tax=Pinctada imbricata TaxID=66713 RepID=A0AA88XPY5_PINIB|nr:hypothetical protein FSP39_019888 [Pinctada imbricata]
MRVLYRKTHTKPIGDTLQDAENTPFVLVGIVSDENNYGLRNAHRKTWLSRRELHGPYRVKVYFLLDISTLALRIEQSRSHDMFFFNSTNSASDVNTGQRLHMWFKFAANTYPEAELVIWMDDEVFLCAPQVFDRLSKISSDSLYYGFVHPQRCVDDNFLVVGMELVKRIADKVYCGSRRGGICTMFMEGHLSDMGSIGNTLCHWLKSYSDIVTVADNFYMRLGYSVTGDTEADLGMHKTDFHNFCSSYLLYHESSVSDIFTFSKHNSRRLQPTIGREHTFSTNNYMDEKKSFDGEIIRNLPNLRTDYPNDQIVRHWKTTGKNCNMWAVFYSVHNFNITDIIDVAANDMWCVIVVEDSYIIAENTFTEASFLKIVRNEFVFLSSAKQNSLYHDFNRFITTRHVSRKNIGYIYAIDHGAKMIWDISEYHSRGKFLVDKAEQDILTVCPEYKDFIMNPLDFYDISQKPRGFPLSFDISQAKSCPIRGILGSGIMQLFDPKHPDVGKTKSVESKPDQTFQAAKIIPLQIPHSIAVPLNYHSTVWSVEAFPYLFLPSTVSSDAADIWRGYIAQTLNNFYFEVSYMPVSSTDFKSVKEPNDDHLSESEDLTKKTDMLIELLNELRRKNYDLNLETFYAEMYKRGYIESPDILLLHVWGKMLANLGIS